jgi:hypothetical protein
MGRTSVSCSNLTKVTLLRHGIQQVFFTFTAEQHTSLGLRLTCGGTAATPTAAGRYVEAALALQSAGYSGGDAETVAATSLAEAVLTRVGTVTDQDFYSCQNLEAL